MNNRIDTRIAVLAAAIQRRQMEQAAPVDGLSASMFEWERELSTLDEQGKVALLEELNHHDEGGIMGLALDMDALERMIEEARV